MRQSKQAAFSCLAWSIHHLVDQLSSSCCPEYLHCDGEPPANYSGGSFLSKFIATALPRTFVHILTAFSSPLESHIVR
jgi:hypothetical protein